MMKSAIRITGVLLRHWYLIRESKMRMVDLFYWPATQVLLWYWIGISIARMDFNRNENILFSFLVATFLLCILIRTQQGITTSVLEELWSRNLIHIASSPLTNGEWILAVTLVAGLRIVLAMVPSALMIALFLDWEVPHLDSIAVLGGLVFLMGWWFGILVTCCVIRFGAAAQNLSYMAIFIIGPFSAVYYPLDVIPEWLWPVAKALPSYYAFEQVRRLSSGVAMDVHSLGMSLGLNIVFSLCAFLMLSITFISVRRNGKFVQIGD